MIKDDYLQFVGFVDIGSCVFYVVYNVFGKGLKIYGKEVDQFCWDFYVIFKNRVVRKEDYQ